MEHPHPPHSGSSRARTEKAPHEEAPEMSDRCRVSAVALANRGRVGLGAGDDAANTTPGLDERRAGARKIALDHPAGDAARVHVTALTDVDADVTHAPRSPTPEGEEIAGAEALRIG